ncbi:hypothetical protein GCM10011348_15980 [Marinobacterium nitratireducens]|uniref:Uncharacterized protein n=1 Tax=Marinobacterium nitratireducens TaxID=518897 RepID=A0A918DQI4_9GAMM|nr:hypothetical protein [Marinobacterium nitratireducens]GGO80082.1 hypothetical protein GCM10011348_15980 [Marinobacterium nitratireducens]
MDFKDTRIGINDAARLLNVRASELKAAIQKGEPLRGIEPPKPLRKQGDHGWVFIAGDVMNAAALMK